MKLEKKETVAASGSGPKQAPTSGIQAHKALVKNLDDNFHSKRLVRRPEKSTALKSFYLDWLGGVAPYSSQAREALHTQFHAVEKVEVKNPLGIKW